MATSIHSKDGRWWLGDHGHVIGMQGVSPIWWRQWTGPGGSHGPFGHGTDAFSRYYPDGLHGWVEDHSDVVLRSGIRLLTQWTDPSLALALREHGVEWVPVLLCSEKTKQWAKAGASVADGVDRVRSACRDLRSVIEGRGRDPIEALSGLIDWQEPIWSVLRYGILPGDAAVSLAQELFPRCADVMREEFPGVPVWGPKLAGSTRRTHERFSWVGWEGTDPGGPGHRWPLLRAASEGREVLNINCYGDRADHRLREQHEWTGLPIAVSEFSRWVLGRGANRLRWADFRFMGRSESFPCSPSGLASAEAITADVMHDVDAPYIIASCLYHYSHHARDWGVGPRRRLFGYLGHVVDPTRAAATGGREWRDEEWIREMGSTAAEANALGLTLRGASRGRIDRATRG